MMVQKHKKTKEKTQMPHQSEVKEAQPFQKEI